MWTFTQQSVERVYSTLWFSFGKTDRIPVPVYFLLRHHRDFFSSIPAHVTFCQPKFLGLSCLLSSRASARCAMEWCQHRVAYRKLMALSPISLHTVHVFWGRMRKALFRCWPPCQYQWTRYPKRPSTDQLTNNSASHRFAKASVVKLTRSSLPCRQRFGRMLQSSHQQMLLMVNGHLGQLHVYLSWFCRLEYPECHQLQSEIPYLPMFWGVIVLQSLWVL